MDTWRDEQLMRMKVRLSFPLWNHSWKRSTIYIDWLFSCFGSVLFGSFLFRAVYCVLLFLALCLSMSLASFVYHFKVGRQWSSVELLPGIRPSRTETSSSKKVPYGSSRGISSEGEHSF